MTEENTSNTPASPETQPARVREELDQDNVTHQGPAVQPSKDGQNVQGYMGAGEDTVTPVMPPVNGPSDLVSGSGKNQSDETIDPSQELTPG